MKRTKRYGGFLVGDRVRYKNCGFIDIEGEVVELKNGNIIMAQMGDIDSKLSFAPNQLINLTRQEEDKEKLQDLELALFPNIWDMFPAPSCIKAIQETSKRAEKELEEKYGLKCGIADNPALKESKENIIHVSEETANELNSLFEKINKHLSQEEQEPTTEEMLTWSCENKPELFECLKFTPLSKDECKERVKMTYDYFKRSKGDKEFNPEDYKDPYDFLTSGELLIGSIQEREEKLRKFQEMWVRKYSKMINNHPYPYNKDFSSTADY